MYVVSESNGNRTIELQSIHDRLEEIRSYMDKELSFKQGIIDGQQGQLERQKILLEEKDTLILRLEEQLAECRQTNEGTRQLINKLLNDISNYQKDIEWYKRTYVKRSLPGTLWTKLFKK